MGIPGPLAPGSPSSQAAPPRGGRDTRLSRCVPRTRGRTVGSGQEGEGDALAGAAGSGAGAAHPRRCSACARLAPVSVSGRANRLRVLGGRGTVEDEDDPPELSDSGDEAAWEDEDDADLPHDKQQTPCLFCDRFVPPSARRHPQGAGPSGYVWSAVKPERPALESLNQWCGVMVC